MSGHVPHERLLGAASGACGGAYAPSARGTTTNTRSRVALDRPLEDTSNYQLAYYADIKYNHNRLTKPKAHRARNNLLLTEGHAVQQVAMQVDGVLCVRSRNKKNAFLLRTGSISTLALMVRYTGPRADARTHAHTHAHKRTYNSFVYLFPFSVRTN